MRRERVTITVEIDCDPVPGAFHDPEDWVRWLEYNLGRNSHYYPTFKLEKVTVGDRKGWYWDKWAPREEEIS